jgi:4-hydroxy-tetrahydrodipicolinate reductase
MKIAIVGYGKMGHLLEAVCREKGHKVDVLIDPNTEAAVYNSVDDADLSSIDMAFEFTSPGTAAANVIALAKKGVKIVCGSTGWYDKLEEVKAAVNDAGTSLIYASNFSLGVNLFYKICEDAAARLARFPDYDAAIFEAHHNKKADSPSGTAKTLAEKVMAKMPAKTKAVYDKFDRPPLSNEIHVASLRLGSLPGTHALLFDSPADTIEIKHTARNREGLARGAVAAAEWLIRQREGVYTMDDMLR